jgi:prevent-host-death family protein
MANEISYREFRDTLADVLNRIEYRSEKFVVTRRGKRVATITPYEEPKMRNVISTNAHADVTDEYAEAVDKILEKEIMLRDTQHREHGQITFRVCVAEYDAPGGLGKRWAVDYADAASREVEEFEDQDAAEERYEEFVRAAANDLSLDEGGDPIPFTYSDVPGVPGYNA